MKKIPKPLQTSRQIFCSLLVVGLLHAAGSQLEEGKRAVAVGKYADAIRLLGAPKPDSERCEAEFYLGLAHYRLRQLDAAIINLQSAIVCAPANPDSFVALAAAYSDKGQDDRAVAAFDAALELQPGNVEALRAGAILDLRHERNERAVLKLQKLAALEPNNAKVHSDLGAAYAGTSNLDIAREQFERALDLSPDNPSALLGLGRVFLKSGQTDDALRMLTRAANAEPRAYQPHFLLASAYNMLGRFSEALAECSESLRLGGKDSEVHYQMARAYRGLARPEDARKALQRFSEMRSQSSRETESRREAGRLILEAKPLVTQDRLPEAIVLLEKAVKQDPNNPQAVFRLAGLYYDTQQFDRARETVRAAIDLAPSEYVYHYLLGLIEKASGAPDAARKSFETAIKLKPATAEILNQLGNLAMSRQDLAEAIQYFEKAAQLDTTEPAYQLNLEVAQKLKAGSAKQD